MAASGSGGTEVAVHTDLAITGKPAQFGRGVMQDVSDKLLGQFVSCLEARLGAHEEPGVPPISAATSAVADPGAPVPLVEADPQSAPAPAPSSVAPADDALNLGAAVLPILAKTYWKPAVAVTAAAAALIWWLGR
jgi:hypothetical protein